MPRKLVVRKDDGQHFQNCYNNYQQNFYPKKKGDFVRWFFGFVIGVGLFFLLIFIFALLIF